MDWTSPWASPSMMTPILEYPWSSPPIQPEIHELSTELLELSDLELQLQLHGIDDLPSDHQLGLERALGAGYEVDYHLAHNDATVTPKFGDADLADILNELRQKNDAKATKPTHSKNEIIKGCTIEVGVHNLGVWGGRRRRKCRNRRASWRMYLLGFQKYFTCERWNTRKNNPHWTENEVCMLLDGLSEYGVGSWTKIKKAYFGTSIRTAVHLKDKWKNLTEASGHEVRSKKKVKAHKSTEEILRRLEDQIIRIDKTDAAQERRVSRRKVSFSPRH